MNKSEDKGNGKRRKRIRTVLGRACCQTDLLSSRAFTNAQLDTQITKKGKKYCLAKVEENSLCYLFVWKYLGSDVL